MYPKTYTIRDAWKWDSCATDTSAKYSVAEGTVNVSHSNDYLVLSSRNNSWNSVYPTGVTLDTSNDFLFEFDCLSQSGNADNIHLGGLLGLTSNASSKLSFLGYKDMFLCFDYASNTEKYKTTSTHVSRNQWYHYSIQSVNGTVTFVVKDSSNNTIVNGSFSLPSTYTTVYPCLVDYVTGGSNTVNYFKNILIMPL